MSNIFFKDTGFPSGVKVKIKKSAGTVTGDLYILAVTNTDNATNEIEFDSDSHLEDLAVSADTTLSLPFPIQCSAFTSPIELSVVYVDKDEA
jgi:hypothetical protein